MRAGAGGTCRFLVNDPRIRRPMKWATDGCQTRQRLDRGPKSLCSSPKEWAGGTGASPVPPEARAAAGSCVRLSRRCRVWQPKCARFTGEEARQHPISHALRVPNTMQEVDVAGTGGTPIPPRPVGIVLGTLRDRAYRVVGSGRVVVGKRAAPIAADGGRRHVYHNPAAIFAARAAASTGSSFAAGQRMPRPVSGLGFGMMWKWTWKTAWWAAGPLFWRTL